MTFKNCEFIGIKYRPYKWVKTLKRIKQDEIFENETFYCYNGNELYTFNNKKPWYKFW